MRKKKLIEVALPLEAINRTAAMEKSIGQGHPWTGGFAPGETITHSLESVIFPKTGHDLLPRAEPHR